MKIDFTVLTLWSKQVSNSSPINITLFWSFFISPDEDLLFEVETSWVKLLCKFQCWWSELNWCCKHYYKGNNLCKSSGAPNISSICWGLVGTYSPSDKWRSKSKVDGILLTSRETHSWDPDWSLSYVVVNSECVINCIDLGAVFFDAPLPVVASL